MTRTRWVLVALVAVAFAASAADPPKGLKVGDEVSAWEPVHVAGPHAGTKTCPVCTYLDAPTLLAFATDATAAGKLAPTLEAIATAHSKGKLKVMLVVVAATDDELKKLATDHRVKQTMLVRPDPKRREKQLKAYKVDPTATNAVYLYQDYAVKAAWGNLAAADVGKLKDVTDPYLPKR